MTRTVGQMVADVAAEVPAFSPQEAHRRIQEDPNTLLIDVRDRSDAQTAGPIPGAVQTSPVSPDTYLHRICLLSNVGVGHRGKASNKKRLHRVMQPVRTVPSYVFFSDFVRAIEPRICL